MLLFPFLQEVVCCNIFGGLLSISTKPKPTLQQIGSSLHNVQEANELADRTMLYADISCHRFHPSLSLTSLRVDILYTDMKDDTEIVELAGVKVERFELCGNLS